MAAVDKIQANLTIRVTIAFALALACFFVIALRLWYLQILRGDYFRDRSENNRLRTIYLPPPRGLILDRNGKILAKTRASFNVELVMEDCPNPEQTISRLAELLKHEVGTLRERLQDQRKRRRFEPRLLLKDVSRDTVAVVVSHRYELPGIIINVVPTRHYEYNALAAHTLGYIREITRNQLDDPRYAGYQMSDEVGQFGIEARWERYLQGKRGVQNVIVNATGLKTGDFSFEPEAAGHNLTLALDFETQRAADAALEGKAGAVVAFDAKTGDILAIASSPAFDPNIFTGDVPPDLWKELTTGKGKILNNRAFQGVYPPGSVFKVFMAAAALSEGVIREHDTISCPGYLHFAGRNYHCHKRQGHGPVDMLKAVTLSCDVYFYTIGNRLGVDRIHEYSTKFGLGLPTGIDLPNEAQGLIPSTAWKRNYFKNPANKKWFPGETLSVSIGQGAVTTTPLQIARGVAALVNGGFLLKPKLMRQIESVDGSFKDTDFPIHVQSKLDVDRKILDKVKNAMVSVVNDPTGTGRRSKLPEELGITVGGKTGTAQVVSLDYHKAGTDRDHHAWFVGFAPAEDPEIVVAAIVEHGGGGGAVAAPVVRQVLEGYFRYVPPPEATPAAKPSGRER